MDRLRDLWYRFSWAPRWVKVALPVVGVLTLVVAGGVTSRLTSVAEPSMDEARGAVISAALDDERGLDAQELEAAGEQPKKRGRKERRTQKREARQALIARDRATPARQLVADETLDGLDGAACPARFGGTSSSSREARAQQQDARSGNFQVLEGQQTRLVAPVDWHMDPFESIKFQGKLQNMSWLDPLFRAYQRGDVGALRQARGLVLDWIRNNPRRGGGLPKKAWGDKVSGDRAPRIAYLTRAATCEEILDRVESRQLLASVERHARFLSDPINHAPSNHGLFVDIGLTRLARQLPFMPSSSAWRQLASSASTARSGGGSSKPKGSGSSTRPTTSWWQSVCSEISWARTAEKASSGSCSSA